MALDVLTGNSNVQIRTEFGVLFLTFHTETDQFNRVKPSPAAVKSLPGVSSNRTEVEEMTD